VMSSGNEVPTPTIITPTIKLDRPKASPMRSAALVNKRADTSNRARLPVKAKNNSGMAAPYPKTSSRRNLISTQRVTKAKRVPLLPCRIS